MHLFTRLFLRRTLVAITTEFRRKVIKIYKALWTFGDFLNFRITLKPYFDCISNKHVRSKLFRLVLLKSILMNIDILLRTPSSFNAPCVTR